MTETSQTNPKNPEYVFKLVLVGDSGVGKSCIIHHFIYNKFKKDTKQTIGVDFSGKAIRISTQNIKLQIWDTAGQEKFRSVARSYYRGAIGIIIVYDITRMESFQHVTSWLTDSRNVARNECSICLVGNKKDLNDQRAVPYSTGEQFCSDNNLLFFETSALSGENIEEIFISVSKNVLGKIEKGIIEPNSVISSYAREMKKVQLNGSDDKSNQRERNCGYVAC